MLSLEMSITAYKKIALRTLLIIFAICVGYYLLTYLLEYLAVRYPSFGTQPHQSRNIFSVLWAFIMTLFLVTGALSLIIAVKLLIKRIQMLSHGKNHFNIDKNAITVLTPLNFFEKKYEFNSDDSKILSINIDKSAKLSFCLTLEVQTKIFYLIFWKSEIIKYSFHLYEADYTKLVNFIKKTHPDLKLTFITASEESRGWKGIGRY